VKSYQIQFSTLRKLKLQTVRHVAFLSSFICQPNCNQQYRKSEKTAQNDNLTFFSWFGMMQRTKLALVLFSVCISLFSCSLYVWPTVLNIPLRVAVRPAPNGPASATAAAMPTISAAVTNRQLYSAVTITPQKHHADQLWMLLVAYSKHQSYLFHSLTHTTYLYCSVCSGICHWCTPT